MGGGTYSYSDRSIRSATMGYTTKSTQEIFKERNINSAMNPYGVGIRESCDSEEHPNSLPIIIALDVTGSMGSVPHFLVKEGFPEIMDSIIKSGINDPQVLFLGIGDHECDKAPLQVGQFESSDELLDKWLTTIFLEGGGGGNDGESYLLAWYFAAYHTRIDSFDKRGKKGFLFTIGDEPTLNEIPKVFLKGMMGDGQYENYSSVKLLEKAIEKYNVYHIHIKETGAGSSRSTMNGWKQLMGENLIIAEHRTDVVKIITDVVTGLNENDPTEGKEIKTKVHHDADMML
jgi:hypothetical protein